MISISMSILRYLKLCLVMDVSAGFSDTCAELSLEHQIFSRELGSSYEQMEDSIHEFFNTVDTLYPSRRKGIFYAKRYVC